MTYRSSFNQTYGGGRASPYAHRLGPQDRSFSDFFEYVESADSNSRSHETHTSNMPLEDEDAPDVIHIKHMGQAYALRFPAYSISESGVTVYEVRRRIAEELHQDQRRIRLVYKDRELKYDPYPIKRYGCKQNSELAVVVTESLNDYGGPDNQHSSGDDSGSRSSLRPSAGTGRPRGLSSVRDRNEDVFSRSDNSKNLLTPDDYKRRSAKRNSLSPGRYSENQKSRDKSPDPPRNTASPGSYRGGTSSSTSSTTETATQASRNPRSTAPPDTPLGKVQVLQDQFYDKWFPQCREFLGSLPSDTVQRDKEYRRLSESIMKHIIEAADLIELQGNQEARAERKKVLGEAQEVLKKLDAVVKSK